MNSTKKNIQKTSGTRKNYKPGQLVTINHRIFRYEKYDFCMELPLGFSLKPISKHKG